jgi:hypothetical protein
VDNNNNNKHDSKHNNKVRSPFVCVCIFVTQRPFFMFFFKPNGYIRATNRYMFSSDSQHDFPGYCTVLYCTHFGEVVLGRDTIVVGLDMRHASICAKG